MTATIPLAKPYTPAKLNYPVFLSTKYDGVPIKIRILDGDGSHTIMSRQGKGVPSVHKLVQEFAEYYVAEGNPVPIELVAEVIQRDDPFAAFKDTGGIVRSQYDRSDELYLMFFECDLFPTFRERRNFMADRIEPFEGWGVAFQALVTGPLSLDAYVEHFIQVNPKAEGMVARNYDDPYKPGKRSWGYQKIVTDPMIDLRIVGFEEAVDQYGEPKGMVGRLIASYKGDKIGVGPGKLTHKERVALWEREQIIPGSDLPLMAQIKYKTDPSYKMLRQPTFQCWRPDKDEPDA